MNARRTLLGALLVLLSGTMACGDGASELVESAHKKWEEQFQQGRLNMALATAQELQQEEPDSPDGYLLAARVQDAKMKPDQVVANLLQAYALQPEQFAQLGELVYAMGLTSNITSRKMHEFVELHASRFPDDPRLWEAEVVALSATIHDADTSEDIRARLLAELTTYMQGYTPPPDADSKTWYFISDALLLLNRTDDALKAMDAGILADTDTWDRLSLEMARAFILLHEGSPETAKQALHDYLNTYLAWTGCHFGMLMPVADYVRLTLKVRFDEDISLPPELEARREEALKREVRSPLGEEAISLTIRDLMAAADLGNTNMMARHIANLQTIFARDRGCIVETRIIKPHTLSMARILYGNALVAAGDESEAMMQYRLALEAYPADPWYQARLNPQTATTEEQ